MLANILPGLREIRAPLAAGYLWFVTAWVLLEDRVDTASAGPGSVDALSRLKESLGPGAVGVAVTFVAYVIGALWEPVAERLAEGAWLVRSSLRKRWEAREDEPSPDLDSALPEIADALKINDWSEQVAAGLKSHTPPFHMRVSRDAWWRLSLVGERLFGETDEVVRGRLGLTGDEAAKAERFVVETRQLWQACAEAKAQYRANQISREERLSECAPVTELEFGSERDLWWQAEADFLEWLPTEHVGFGWSQTMDILVLAKPKGEDTLRVLRRGDVTTRLFTELSLSARRLVGEEQESYLEASRMEGEVQFRFALAIPLAVATSVVTFGLGESTWVWAGATAAGVLAGAALLVDGWRRDRKRNDLLVELLAIGKAKSPTFERLLERAKQAKPRGWERSPLDEAEASSVASPASR